MSLSLRSWMICYFTTQTVIATLSARSSDSLLLDVLSGAGPTNGVPWYQRQSRGEYVSLETRPAVSRNVATKRDDGGTWQFSCLQTEGYAKLDHGMNRDGQHVAIWQPADPQFQQVFYQASCVGKGQPCNGTDTRYRSSCETRSAYVPALVVSPTHGRHYVDMISIPVSCTCLLTQDKRYDTQSLEQLLRDG